MEMDEPGLSFRVGMDSFHLEIMYDLENGPGIRFTNLYDITNKTIMYNKRSYSLIRDVETSSFFSKKELHLFSGALNYFLYKEIFPKIKLPNRVNIAYLSRDKTESASVSFNALDESTLYDCMKKILSKFDYELFQLNQQHNFSYMSYCIQQ